MFTGIVQGVAQIIQIADQPGLRSMVLQFPAGFAQGLEIGASVAVDGVCLTVTTRIEEDKACFDVMQKTLEITSLAGYHVGSRVNVERAAREGAEIGGHPLSGHIDCVAELAQVRELENNHVLRIAVDRACLPYIFAKGYIAINGASLTIAEVDKQAAWFEVWLIPETLRMTVFAEKREGHRVNLEIERSTQVIVDTVNAILAEKLGVLLPQLETLAQVASKADGLGKQ